MVICYAGNDITERVVEMGNEHPLKRTMVKLQKGRMSYRGIFNGYEKQYLKVGDRTEERVFILLRNYEINHNPDSDSVKRRHQWSKGESDGRFLLDHRADENFFLTVYDD